MLTLPKPKLTAVEVPEWAEAGHPTVYVRTMGGADRMTYELENHRLVGDETDAQRRGELLMSSNLQGRLLVRVLCDEAGKPLFTPGQAGEVGGQDYTVVERLYNVAAPLNGLGADAAAAAEKK